MSRSEDRQLTPSLHMPSHIQPLAGLECGYMASVACAECGWLAKGVEPVKTPVAIEATYQLRMLDQPWRRKGMHVSAVCRCEPATPCFDHTVYLADLREEAEVWENAGKTIKAALIRKEATEFYLKLTAKENQ